MKLAFNPSKCKHTWFSTSPEEHSHTYLLNEASLIELISGTLILTSLITFHCLITTPSSPKPIILFTLSVVLSHLTIPSLPNLLYIHLLSELALPTAVKSSALTCSKDIKSREQVQRRSTKFVNNYQLNDKGRLISLKLLPLTL